MQPQKKNISMDSSDMNNVLIPNTMGISTFISVNIEHDSPKYRWRIYNMPRIQVGPDAGRPALTSIWATLREEISNL